MSDKRLITIQVFTAGPAAEAEDAAVRYAREIEDDLFRYGITAIQTVMVHEGPFRHTDAGFVLADKANLYKGEDE